MGGGPHILRERKIPFEKLRTIYQHKRVSMNVHSRRRASRTAVHSALSKTSTSDHHVVYLGLQGVDDGLELRSLVGHEPYNGLSSSDSRQLIHHAEHAVQLRALVHLRKWGIEIHAVENCRDNRGIECRRGPGSKTSAHRDSVPLTDCRISTYARRKLPRKISVTLSRDMYVQTSGLSKP